MSEDKRDSYFEEKNRKKQKNRKKKKKNCPVKNRKQFAIVKDKIKEVKKTSIMI